MKIAITGHTRGLGHALFNLYTSEEIEVLGYSKSTGFNISNKEVVDKIIEQTLDCTVFINNAYDPYGQNELALKWFDNHKHKNHLLVNISSIAPIADSYINEKFKHIQYSTQKAQLDKISWDINFSDCAARCINVSPGLVDTEMAHPIYINRFRENNSVIPPESLAKMIKGFIDQYFEKKWFVPHIYLINNDIFVQ